MNIDTLTVRNALPQSTQRKDPPVVSEQSSAATTAAPVQALPSKAQPTVEQVHAAADQIAQFLKNSGRVLDFHVDTDTGEVVVSVRDASSGDLIRQMPSEEALRLARTLHEGSKSLFELTA